MTAHARGFEYRFRGPLSTPESRGGAPPSYRRSIDGPLLIERDLAVRLRDGVEIYVDLFRPADERPAAPLVGWSPYGKHIPGQLGKLYPNSGVKEEHTSIYTAFEAPDPAYWVPRGYAVINADIRGTWYSRGEARYCAPEEALDLYDLIEWAGAQPWSTGKVGLSGVSYLTVMQWRVAELQPPHLAAINPWEGWTDTYREVVRHGGIPDSWFWPYMWARWGASTTRIEDLERETREHPFFDAYWASKAADLPRITVPAYVVASWTDQGLHTRGTLEGFKRIASKRKWLEIHGRKKWHHYYEPESVRRQQAFFDHFLRGLPTEIGSWPTVRLEVRERYYVGSTRAEDEWPLARTRYTKLHLDATDGSLQWDPVVQAASRRYDPIGTGTGPHRAEFTLRFEHATELIGHMKLRLFVSVEGGDDMDLFVAIQKLDRAGALVPFAFYAHFEDGPVALGWLRVSHRELDEQRSTEFQPVLAHRRALPLGDGEVAPVDVEIWPSGTRFEAGESLRVVIQGTDVYRYPKPLVASRHEHTVNRGRHVIHTGGIHDSHLLVPIVPPRAR
jgi:predicted acyl esterase